MRDLVPLVSSCLPTSALGQKPHSHRLGLLASAIAAACASEVVGSVCVPGLGIGSILTPGVRSGKCPPLLSLARSHQALSPPPRVRSSHTLGLLPPRDMSFPLLETDKGMPTDRKLKGPAVSTLTATYTHYSPRVWDRSTHVLLSAPLKSHTFSVGLKGCSNSSGSFS